jgi:hypothetical protein
MSLQSLRHAVNHDQPGDAARQQKGRRYECCSQRASGIKPAVASKGDNDVSPQQGRLPTRQAPSNLQHHCHFKQAAAGSTHQAPPGKNLG